MNYEILGRKWCYTRPLREAIAHWRELESTERVEPDCETRSSLIRRKLFFPALRHLGFGPIDADEVRREVDDGVTLSVDYFHGDWWRADAIRQFDFTDDEKEDLIEFNRSGLDKSYPHRKLQWYTALTSALFLAGLVERWGDLSKICSWFDATIEPEYQAGEIEDEYQLVLLCIAGSLALEPMAGADQLLAKIKKCRTKRPRLLCAAWEAADAGDQDAFDDAFPESVEHFLSKPNDGQIYDWVAIHQSSIWFIAEHNGLKLPTLTDKQRAAVVTRQSAGLADYAGSAGDSH